jgi:hypothetical protein
VKSSASRRGVTRSRRAAVEELTIRKPKSSPTVPAWRTRFGHRHIEDRMQLQPRRERGRSDRKAAAYASEILRLRGEGYTFEAIREALIDIGVVLSEATLRREVRRCADGVASALRPAPMQHANDKPAAGTVPLAAPPTSGPSGREIAEAFFHAHPSNPLLRAKDKP